MQHDVNMLPMVVRRGPGPPAASRRGYGDPAGWPRCATAAPATLGRMRLRHQAPALVLAALAVAAVAVAAAAEHIAWPMAPAFPWAHGSDFAYVAGTRNRFVTAETARVVAWGSSGLSVVLAAAAVVAAAARRRTPPGRRA